MTNYNERLDKLMPCCCNFLNGFAWRKGDPCEGCINGRLKQAITSLTKELVAEAKPKEYEDYYANDPIERNRKISYDEAVREFEQNLLKGLEEV